MEAALRRKEAIGTPHRHGYSHYAGARPDHIATLALDTQYVSANVSNSKNRPNNLSLNELPPTGRV